MIAGLLAWGLSVAWARGEADAPPPPDAPPASPPSFPPAPRVETAGWRAISLAGAPSVASRLAFVEDPGGPFIGEMTVRAQAASRSFGAAVEIAGVAGVSDVWRGAGLGNVVVDVRGIWGDSGTFTLGLRGTLPAGDRGGAHGAVGYWGSVPAATVPMWGLSLVTGGAAGRWVWDLHAGVHLDRFRLVAYADGILDLGFSLATVRPLGRGWDGIVEAELIVGQSPIHLRALVRRRVGPGSFDIGLALPVLAMFLDPTLQIIANVRFGPNGARSPGT